jgi:2Fe-2S ferredoxin
MAKITFVTDTGDAVQAEAEAGFSLMEVAVDNEVPGVVAECGGACACATCHVYVDESWLARLPAVDDMEDAMLDATVERRPNSRLSCQIEVTAALDGLRVTVADNQA